jgi:hypothetical protein
MPSIAKILTLNSVSTVHLSCYDINVLLVFYVIFERMILISYGYLPGRTEIIQPKVQPVYVKSGDTLELICEHDDPFSLQWFRAPLLVSPRHYTKIDTSSESGFYMTSQVKDGRGWTNLTKSNVSVNDAGSYRCSLVSKPDRAYAVDVIVLIGKYLLILLTPRSLYVLM